MDEVWDIVKNYNWCCGNEKGQSRQINDEKEKVETKKEAYRTKDLQWPLTTRESRRNDEITTLMDTKDLFVTMCEYKQKCLRTRIPIKKGTAICKYEGERISNDDLCKLIGSFSEERISKLFYVDKFNNKSSYYIDVLNDSHAQFMNHTCSCKATVYPKLTTIDGIEQVIFFAKKDLESNTELVWEYNKPTADVPYSFCFCRITKSNQEARKHLNRCSIYCCCAIKESRKIVFAKEHPLSKLCLENNNSESNFDGNRTAEPLSNIETTKEASFMKVESTENVSDVIFLINDANFLQSIEKITKNRRKINDLRRKENKMDIELINTDDLLTLRQNQWINESVINFYLSALLTNSEIKYIPTYGINTLRSSKILPSRWYWQFKGTETIFVPAFLYSNHWALYYVECQNKMITIVDSYSKRIDDEKVEFYEILLKILFSLSERENVKIGEINEWSFIRDADATKQENSNDCGLFTLMFCACKLANKEYYEQQDIEEFRRQIIKKIYEWITFLASKVEADGSENIKKIGKFSLTNEKVEEWLKKQ